MSNYKNTEGVGRLVLVNKRSAVLALHRRKNELYGVHHRPRNPFGDKIPLVNMRRNV